MPICNGLSSVHHFQGSPQPSGVSALYWLHVFTQMSAFWNMINSASSNHSLWHWIDYRSSGRGRRREKRQREWWQGKVNLYLSSWEEREKAAERGEAADIRMRLIRHARDEEDITNAAHKYTPTYKQTVPLCKSILYILLSANQTPEKVPTAKQGICWCCCCCCCWGPARTNATAVTLPSP